MFRPSPQFSLPPLPPISTSQKEQQLPRACTFPPPSQHHINFEGSTSNVNGATVLNNSGSGSGGGGGGVTTAESTNKANNNNFSATNWRLDFFGSATSAAAFTLSGDEGAFGSSGETRSTNNSENTADSYTRNNNIDDDEDDDLNHSMTLTSFSIPSLDGSPLNAGPDATTSTNFEGKEAEAEPNEKDEEVEEDEEYYYDGFDSPAAVTSPSVLSGLQSLYALHREAEMTGQNTAASSFCFAASPTDPVVASFDSATLLATANEKLLEEIYRNVGGHTQHHHHHQHHHSTTSSASYITQSSRNTPTELPVPIVVGHSQSTRRSYPQRQRCGAGCPQRQEQNDDNSSNKKSKIFAKSSGGAISDDDEDFGDPLHVFPLPPPSSSSLRHSSPRQQRFHRQNNNNNNPRHHEAI